jgi:hypothetical protein
MINLIFDTVLCGSTMTLIDQDWWTKYFEVMEWINREHHE